MPYIRRPRGKKTSGARGRRMDGRGRERGGGGRRLKRRGKEVT